MRKAQRRLQRGALLVELVIGAAVLGLVIAYVLDMQRQNDVQLKAKSDAEAQSMFIQVASQYFLNNRTAYDAAMDTGVSANQYCMLGVNADGTGGTQANSTTLHTCAFDATLLVAKGLWPEGLSTETKDGRFTVILRRIYDATPAATGGHEAFFVLASPSGALTSASMNRDTSTALAAGKASLGTVGGYVPVGNMGGCSAVRSTSTYQACGEGWQVNLSNFISPTELTTFGNALPN
ncbi:type II secretion system protein [Caenimonas sedimenti]|uniref:type II secretion system protein n=1 Tax=Caenimonas sedimenti TaxID=2596921 RepID=UPI001645CB90|nr:type II secretion system protein [Caenimonas sedimenti]